MSYDWFIVWPFGDFAGASLSAFSDRGTDLRRDKFKSSAFGESFSALGS